MFYHAVATGLVPKEETTGYRLVQRRLIKLRESRQIPYRWITDGSSTVYGFSRYAGADEFAQTVASRYRHDYWAEADESVQIWVEKDAMVGVVRPVTDEFGLTCTLRAGSSALPTYRKRRKN